MDLHLPLLEANAVIPETETTGDGSVGVVEIGDGGLVVGVAQKQTGGGNLLLVVDPQTEVQIAGDIHLVGGLGFVLELLFRIAVDTGNDVLRLVLLVVGNPGQETELHTVVHVEPIADVHLAVDVLGNVVFIHGNIPVQGFGQLLVDLPGLRQCRGSVPTLQNVEDVAGPDFALILLEGLANPAGQCPGAIVRSQPVVVTAVVGKAAAGGVGVVLGTDFHIEQEVIGNTPGFDIDIAAAEFGAHVRGIGLLNRQGIDDAGGEDIQRQHAAGQIRTGDHGAVQQGAGITLPQAPHIDELVVHQRHPGDPTQRGRHVRIADPADHLGTEQVHGGLVLQALHDHTLRGASQTGHHHHFLDAATGCGLPGGVFAVLLRHSGAGQPQGRGRDGQSQ